MEKDDQHDKEDQEEAFTDDEGDQPYPAGEIALDRGVITTPYDAPVRTLLGEIKDKVLIVNPPFQRQSVWKRDRQSRLIESLLLNIPIPVLYFAEDEDGTRVVVDGQQRLRAVDDFHAGRYRLTKLEVLSDLNGKSWTDLTPKQGRTVLSRTLRCVVISEKSPPELRFEMFERLNTGGTPLNDQELRNCVFQGKLNDLLDEIVHSKPWLSLVGRAVPDYRMRHHELVLRFLALDSVLENYRPPLKGLLNDFMRSRRSPDSSALEGYRDRFLSAATNVQAVFGTQAFRRVTPHPGGDGFRWDHNLNRAVFDVQMLGFAGLPTEEVATRREAILQHFRDLCLQNTEFLTALTLATADRRSLYTRLRIWGQQLAAMGLEPQYHRRLPKA